MEEAMIEQEEVVDNVDETEKPKEAQESEKKQQRQSSIQLDSRGLLKAKDSTEEHRVASGLIQSRAVPKVFQDPMQVMMAMQFLKRYGIDPIIGLRQCTIVNGSLSLWGELPLSVVKRSKEFEWIIEIIYDKNYKEINFENRNLDTPVWGATCWVKLTKREKPYEASFTIEDAKKANLLSKDIWQKYLKRMLQMRARSWCLKDADPAALSGAHILEYDEGTLVDSNGIPMPMKDVGSFAGRLNQSLNKEEESNGVEAEQLLSESGLIGEKSADSEVGKEDEKV